MKKDLGNDGYIVIPVTYQQIAEASRTYEKHQWGLTSIVADTVLGRVFPHSSIPHMVWIKDGRVVAIPKIDYATVCNISAVLEGKHPRLTEKTEDRMVDPIKPFFVGGNGDAEVVYADAYAMITGHIPLYRTEGVNCRKVGD